MNEIELPADLAARIGDVRWIEETIGESAARTFRLEPSDGAWGRQGSVCELGRAAPGGRPVTYLKVSPHRGTALADEVARLRWLEGRLPVPAVLDYRTEPDREILWVTALPGVNAAHPKWRGRADEVVPALGRALRTIHAIDVRACPFDRRLAVAVAEARENVRRGLVDESDFDAKRLGRTAEDVLRELEATIPRWEELVFTHGDYCLPNVILDDADQELAVGFVDVSRAGVADRHQDIALALRSIRRNFGEEWFGPFLREYGMPEPDKAKLEFYQLLDEFM